MVAQGGLRGQLPLSIRFLVVSLFDGIGALRVAMDLQAVAVCGYISVESNPSARRVVESNYPGSCTARTWRQLTKPRSLSGACASHSAALLSWGLGHLVRVYPG